MKTVTPETAKRLKELGMPQETDDGPWFVWINHPLYGWVLSHDAAIDQSLHENAERIAAYTAGELMEWLPYKGPVRVTEYSEWHDLQPGIYEGYLQVEKSETQYRAGYEVASVPISYIDATDWDGNLAEALGLLAIKVLENAD